MDSTAPPPSTISAMQEQDPAVPETLRDIPVHEHDVKASIDTLADGEGASHDIRAPGANVLPLEHLVGVPYFPERPLLEGLPKEHVWDLIRRFDKQVSRVVVVPGVPTGHLDLQTAGDDEFSPEGLRSNLERAYKVLVKSKPVLISAVEPYRVSRPSAIFFGVRAAAHHLAALATWRDRRRTAWFAAGYFAAWYFHLLLFAVLAVLLVLIVHPPARALLFPHAPELVGPQPYLDSDKIVDKLAPVSILVTNQVAEKVVLDPGTAPSIPATASATEEGDEDDTHIWQQAKPAMQVLALISDTWERFANALSPTAPFPPDAARRRLALALAPLALAAPFLTPALVVRALTFGLGVLLFGWPVVRTGAVRSVRYLNARHPRWTEAFDLRHSLLTGVPTDAQLALTLLRIAEAQRAPLPPPPATAPGPGDDPYADEFSRHENPSSDAVHGPPNDLADLTTTDAINAEYRADQAADAEQQDAAAAEAGDNPGTAARTAEAGRSVLARALRTSARVAGKTVERARHVKSTVKDHLPGSHAGGATVQPHDDDDVAEVDLAAVADAEIDTRTRPVYDGPNSFAGRHRGHKGQVVLADGALTFRPWSRPARARALLPGGAALTGNDTSTDDADNTPTAALRLADIVDVRKVGGPSTGRELLAGAAADGMEGGGAGGAGHGYGGGHGLPGGLAVTDRWGRDEAFTTLERRDELFDRIVAAAPVRWEVGSAWT